MKPKIQTAEESQSQSYQERNPRETPGSSWRGSGYTSTLRQWCIMSARLQVSDLIAHPGTARAEQGSDRVSVAFINASVDGEVGFDLAIRSLTDGVVVRGSIDASVDLTCTRCLITWTEELTVPVEAVFRKHPDDTSDELPIDAAGWIDIGEVIHDEVALGLPKRPLCKDDCLGLCPTCGTDLNVDPCEGHGDTLESPFAVLRQLLADETPRQLSADETPQKPES